MELKIYKNINECGKLWQNFSSDNRLFDLWDFRSCFYDKEETQPYFVTGRERGKTVGVIPLSFDKAKSSYTYFGGWFPERNSFFVNDKTKLGQMLEQCPYNTVIEGINPTESKHFNFLEDEYTYYIDLTKYNNKFDNYFNSFEKKKQKNFKRELKSIPKFKVYRNRLRDFKRLVDLNIRQFDEESIYNDEKTKNAILKMIKVAHRKGMLEMLSIQIGNKTEAVDVGIKYKNGYYVVTGSSNNYKIPNIGKLMTTLDIKNAITKRAKFVDFLASSGYWKGQWKFDRDMLFKFQK